VKNLRFNYQDQGYTIVREDSADEVIKLLNNLDQIPTSMTNENSTGKGIFFNILRS
jgi:hypothetical protein